MHPTSDALLPVELFVLLIAIATGLALLARRTALPWSVTLVLAGLGLAVLVPDTLAIQVTPDLILAVLLPGLVFEAAYKLDLAELRRTSTTVGRWALVVDVEDSIVGSFATLGNAPAVALFDVVPPRRIEAAN